VSDGSALRTVTRARQGVNLCFGVWRGDGHHEFLHSASGNPQEDGGSQIFLEEGR
jgi:hypothetical protein